MLNKNLPFLAKLITCILVIHTLSGCTTTPVNSIEAKKIAPMRKPLTKPMESLLKEAKYMPINSDDWEEYKYDFMAASLLLIEKGYCTQNDFAKPYTEAGEMSPGWTKAGSSKFSSKAVYFKYCRTPHVKNRYYISVHTDEIFQGESVGNSSLEVISEYE